MPQDLIHLAQLRVFTIVVEEGSAARAALRLFRAQSAVTRALRELEDALGEPLMERHASGMLPTPVGRAVYERACRVFAELEQLAQWSAARQTRARAIAAGAIPPYLLNTRRLQLLVALVRHQHMPSAAQALGVSQPAVSSAMRILETGAGAALFHRTARGVQLTSEGETFALRVRRALNELRHIPDDIAAVQGSIRGFVTVGALPFSRTLILPEAIARVRRAWPGVHVITDESAYETLVAGLRAGDIDFILGALRPTDPASGVHAEPLISENMVALVRPDHPLAGKRRLRLEQLAEAEWILPRKHTPARSMLDALFVRAGLEPPVPAVETADLATIRGLLLRTDMIAVLSAHQVHYELQTGHMAILNVPLAQTERDIGLTMRAAFEPSPAARKLADAIREVARETIADKQNRRQI
ncbi:LysR family transcriptional regulator [Paraburkholderia acidisoli]|uniref:LysR family transcriptional regulator n=1 Tax=Paraburkholderia acidisoli TaxID=2571748 RepID=A0A7Z2GN94_9BURK|nr:LysR family transcriptional regulator [Paraburkholderia acidisoli]